MAVAWRSTCLILLLVASFQLATIVYAQTDYSFARWFTAAGRAVPDTVCDNAQPTPKAFRLCELHYEDRHPDFKEYEKDKAEAAKRGISFDEIFSERKAHARIAEEKRERERAEAEKRQTIFLAVAATIAILVIVIVFRARRRIAAAISRRWRGKSKAFRVWVFGSFFWVVGTLFLVEYPPCVMSCDDQVRHWWGTMIVPPLFLGAVWFGYERFVK